MVAQIYNPSSWVDRFYDIHPFMKSHSGMILSIGKGVTLL